MLLYCAQYKIVKIVYLTMNMYLVLELLLEVIVKLFQIEVISVFEVKV